MKNIVSTFGNNGLFYLELDPKINSLKDSFLLIAAWINNPEQLVNIKNIDTLGLNLNSELPVWIRLTGNKTILRKFSQEDVNKDTFLIGVPTQFETSPTQNGSKLVITMKFEDLIIGRKDTLSVNKTVSKPKQDEILKDTPSINQSKSLNLNDISDEKEQVSNSKIDFGRKNKAETDEESWGDSISLDNF